MVAGSALVVLVSGPLSPANANTLGIAEPHGHYLSGTFPSRSVESASNSRIGSKQYFVGYECLFSSGLIVFKILLSHVIHSRLLSEPKSINIGFL